MFKFGTVTFLIYFLDKNIFNRHNKLLNSPPNCQTCVQRLYISHDDVMNVGAVQLEVERDSIVKNTIIVLCGANSGTLTVLDQQSCTLIFIHTIAKYTKQIFISNIKYGYQHAVVFKVLSRCNPLNKICPTIV